MSSVRGRLVPVALAGLLVLAGPPSALRAADDPAVARGVQFLRTRANGSQIGETALIALAMLKADVPPGDPAVAACVAKLRARFSSGGYDPERKGGADVYEAAAVSLAISNLNSEARRAELSTLANYLVSKQKANGSWDYDSRQAGDTSISQYAVLGLWEAENGGASVPPQVWDRAAQWFLSSQAAGGSWNYHRDEGGNPETVSMTAAGVGSLLICQRQLAKNRRGSVDQGTALLTPLGGEARTARYDAAVAPARVVQGVRRGLSWLAANFTTSNAQVIGPSAYYGLYGVERIGALADTDTLGRVDWFDQGKRFLHSTQRGDGAWDSTHGDVPNTAWSVLFLTKSTAKTMKRIEAKQLGAGTLLGGRGLPKDLTNLTVAGGRVVSRPMNGAVEGMLAALEDPRGDNADSALAGLVGRYRTEGPGVLRPQKERFRKLLADRDPGLRRVAAWALGRTGDLDAVPALAGALTDPEEAVVQVARDGLQLLSRKLDGLGPPSPSTPAQRQEAAARWRAWYASVRPLDLEAPDDEPPPPSATARSPRPR